MTDPAAPTTPEDSDIEAIRKALTIGEISYDGDPWYAASNKGGAGIGYDECEAALKEGRAALNRLAEARSTSAETLDVERLRRALLYAGFADQNWQTGDIDLPLADVEKVAAEYARLRSPENDR